MTKRYASIDGRIRQHPEGEYVEWDDYHALEKELAAVKAEVPCPECDGRGSEPRFSPPRLQECAACKGSGKKYREGK